ncbi:MULTISPECIES: hypothetical protein [unclassified Marinobacter]|uniref:hypothetical protein n=1 Tax=unclassified Marinobacter TaxID=83889 RepID=UPI001927EC99|nr:MULTISPECIES: hypothetical protein [unclassified Marinobacter]MBL3826038.1 hypothetical protein [Marinobacter sp. MC3]MBL3894387.1 hypothetical protein [Marinobacter sp. MW3]
MKTQLPESFHLPCSTVRQTVINLLVLIIAMQPLLAFGQFTTETTQSPSWSDEVMIMGCCDSGLTSTAGHPEKDAACGDMASADCALAASLGSCGAMLSALVSEKDYPPAQSSSGSTLLHTLDGYLSIILNTLTPPPNSSKA